MARMRRVRWAAGVLAGVVALVLAAGYWSGRQPDLDVVAAGQKALGIELRSAMVPTNGIRLHVVDAGPTNGPPVVLLHGYPEFWWGWAPQILRLARAGFHVVVPDQRGYDGSDKPPGIVAYRLETLGLDITGLIHQLGYDAVYLAGHDWGGVVAWHLAIEHPERVRRLVVFNMGHPLAFQEARAEATKEETISWYLTFFQLPWLPELVAPFGNWGLLAKNLRDTSRPGTFPDTEMVYYKSTWAHPGAMGAMINWYRAGFRYPRAVAGDGTVRVPTRIVWGLRDTFLESRLARLSTRHCTDASVVEIPDAGHWLLHEEPDLTSRQMIEFFHEG